MAYPLSDSCRSPPRWGHRLRCRPPLLPFRRWSKKPLQVHWLLPSSSVNTCPSHSPTRCRNQPPPPPRHPLSVSRTEIPFFECLPYPQNLCNKSNKSHLLTNSRAGINSIHNPALVQLLYEGSNSMLGCTDTQTQR